MAAWWQNPLSQMGGGEKGTETISCMHARRPPVSVSEQAVKEREEYVGR